MTTSEVEREYAAFAEMMRKLTGRVVQALIADEQEQAKEAALAALTAAAERSKALEAGRNGARRERREEPENRYDSGDLNREYGQNGEEA